MEDTDKQLINLQTKKIHKNNVVDVLNLPQNKFIKDLFETFLKSPPTDKSLWSQCVSHIIQSLNNYLNTSKNWNMLSPPQLQCSKEQITRYFFKLIHPMWYSGDLKEKDNIFYQHLISIQRLLTPQLIDLPDEIINHQLFVNSVDEMYTMDLHCDESPFHLLLSITSCCNSLSIVLRNYAGRVAGGADGLVNILILTIVKTIPKHWHSLIMWIYEFSSDMDQSGELFCLYTQMTIATHYLASLTPTCRIVRVPLICEQRPSQLLTHFHDEREYNSILEPLREIIRRESNEMMTRLKGSMIGTIIGGVISSPFAIAVGILTSGFGIPLGVGLVAVGTTLGGACGAVIPLNIGQQKHSMFIYIDSVNYSILKDKTLILISPFITNHLNLITSTCSQIKDIEFIVKSMC